MKVLVTGGAGFIGSHVVEQLIKRKHTPIVLDNLSTGKKINLPKGVKLYQMDIVDQKIENVFKKEKVDAVCHLAAATVVPKSIENPLNDIKNNVLGMVNLLENCRRHQIKKFVFSSTGGALYGNTNILPTPEGHPTHPISPYGVNKLAGENYLFYYNKIHNLPSVVLRYSNVFGPRQDRKGEGGVVAVFLKKLMTGETPTINGNGKQTRDFVFVDDVARANVLALENKSKDFLFCNISNKNEVSVNQIFNILAKAIKSDVKPHHGPARPEVKRSCLDNRRAFKMLGWKPENAFEQGIDKTIKYFKENYKQL